MKEYIKLIQRKPSPLRFINWALAILCFFTAFALYAKDKDIFDIVFLLLLGVIQAVDACMLKTPSWNLKSPNTTKNDLYKIGNSYVSAASLEEAELWADLSQIDSEPEYIGRVNHFEK